MGNLESKYSEILNKIKKKLSDGVTNRKSPYHLITIATIDANNSPKQRIVVNRKVDFKNRAIFFHTDFRSPKIEQIQNNQSVSMIFYNKEDKIQVRIEGKARLHNQDEIADERWQKTKDFSRKCYLQKQASSSQIEDKEEDFLDYSDDHSYGYENFCVVEVKFDSLEYLYLHHEGHQRFRFQWDGKNIVNVERLAP
jgi:pyridoxine/pyridoxamine 5'-phosphate oxidase